MRQLKSPLKNFARLSFFSSPLSHPQTYTNPLLYTMHQSTNPQKIFSPTPFFPLPPLPLRVLYIIHQSKPNNVSTDSVSPPSPPSSSNHSSPNLPLSNHTPLIRNTLIAIHHQYTPIPTLKPTPFHSSIHPLLNASIKITFEIYSPHSVFFPSTNQQWPCPSGPQLFSLSPPLSL